eukprot:GEMP01117161.1.p1 GENE.GEMP01117161.1~~GEMP01117161.1.p1  ORF type:complete len:103 (-),score=3.02 GEMP01117161.1:19-327(-)
MTRDTHTHTQTRARLLLLLQKIIIKKKRVCLEYFYTHVSKHDAFSVKPKRESRERRLTKKRFSSFINGVFFLFLLLLLVFFVWYGRSKYIFVTRFLLGRQRR